MKNKYVITFVLFALLFSVWPSALTAQEPIDAEHPSSIAGPDEITEGDWLVFTDPLYDFSISYPSSWYVTPRDDSPGRIGGSVILTSYNPDDFSQLADGIPSGESKIEIGIHLLPIEPDESLVEWMRRYESLAQMDQLSITSETLISLGGSVAIRQDATSPLLSYTAVEARRGSIVWFIWTNAETGRSPTFKHILRSFRFGPRAPTSLKQLYGDTYDAASMVDVSTFTVKGRKTRGLHAPSGYALPFRSWPNWIEITNGPGCSTTHQDEAAEAIDYSMVVGTPIRATAYSIASDYAGYRTDGYGWTRILRDDSGNYNTARRALYAHLSSLVTLTFPVYTGTLIAYSGNSGNTTGPHLHFHVKRGPDVYCCAADAVDISDLWQTEWTTACQGRARR